MLKVIIFQHVILKGIQSLCLSHASTISKYQTVLFRIPNSVVSLLSRLQSDHDTFYVWGPPASTSSTDSSLQAHISMVLLFLCNARHLN